LNTRNRHFSSHIARRKAVKLRQCDIERGERCCSKEGFDALGMVSAIAGEVFKAD
jgi:hypothetical protein